MLFEPEPHRFLVFVLERYSRVSAEWNKIIPIEPLPSSMPFILLYGIFDLKHDVKRRTHPRLIIGFVYCCSYERHAILEWFSACTSGGRPHSSPMTGEEISSGDVTSNLTLKSRIQVGRDHSPAYNPGERVVSCEFGGCEFYLIVKKKIYIYNRFEALDIFVFGKVSCILYIRAGQYWE